MIERRIQVYEGAKQVGEVALTDEGFEFSTDDSALRKVLRKAQETGVPFRVGGIENKVEWVGDRWKPLNRKNWSLLRSVLPDGYFLVDEK